MTFRISGLGCVPTYYGQLMLYRKKPPYKLHLTIGDLTQVMRRSLKELTESILQSPRKSRYRTFGITVFVTFHGQDHMFVVNGYLVELS
jgi:hypothetical protein